MDDVRNAGLPPDSLNIAIETPQTPEDRLQYEDVKYPLLFILLAAAIAIFVYALPKDPVLYTRITSPWQTDDGVEVAREVAEITKHDPYLGTTLPLPRVAAGAGNKQPKAHVIAFVGSCSRCMSSALRYLDMLHARRPDIAVAGVSTGTAEDIATYRKTTRTPLAIVTDPSKSLVRPYNAKWVPRMYVVSDKGRLLWCQKDWRLDVQEVDRAIADLNL
jgi:hypothetical protein